MLLRWRITRAIYKVLGTDIISDKYPGNPDYIMKDQVRELVNRILKIVDKQRM